MVVLKSSQMQAVEQAAVQSGLDYLRLMENAGSAAAKAIRSHYDIAAQSVVILCGKGNNGGDGFVIARRLQDEGASVTILLTCGYPATKNAAEMLSRVRKSETRIVNLQTEPYVATDVVREAAFIVDAVYGIGFNGTLPGHLRSLFRTVNAHTVPVIAADLPSGLHADTGDADPDALKADLTITFTASKPGLASPAGMNLCGRVLVVSIGIDEELLRPYTSEQNKIYMDMVKECFPPRKEDSHKGDYGRLLTLCGSRGMTGAAVMAVQAALRCGIGLVVPAVLPSLYPLMAVQLCEPVFCLLEEASDGDFSLSSRGALHQQIRSASALLIGCGLGTSPGAKALALDCLKNAACPIVLDADGINIVAEHINIGKTVHAPLIITPHPGEMARLTRQSIDEVQADRMGAAQRFCEETGWIVVLKGNRTIVAAPGQLPLINPTGNPGMATGGSGDVLAGIIASFAAQGMSPRNAAICGTYLHGLAGDRAADRLSQRAMLPSDLIDELSELFLILENRS